MRIIFPNPAGAISLLEMVDPQLLDEVQTDMLNSWLTQAHTQLEARNRRTFQQIPVEVVTNAFEEAAAEEPEWKHIPNFAEFEINREGEVRNALTKLPLKPSKTRNPGFFLRDDRGRKMVISRQWIQDRVHFTN